MKKTYFKVIVGSILVAFSLPMLASCGGGGTTNSSNQPNNGSEVASSAPVEDIKIGQFDPNKDVTISFYHTMGQNLQDVLNMYLEDFKALYPNITVTHKAIGNYDDVRSQMTTEIAAGATSADITYCYPDHVALYNKANKVMPLDDFINDETYGIKNMDDFIPAYLEEGKSFGDGKYYSLPFAKSSEVMYYDKTFFGEHKLKVPETWDQLEETCKKIQEIDMYSTPLGYDSESNFFITMCEQLNSPYTSSDSNNHFQFDNEVNRGFVQRFKDWFDQGYVTTANMYKSYTSSLFTAKGGKEAPRCYICIGSSAGASYQKPEVINNEFRFDVGIAPIPQADVENHPAVISQGPSICVFKNSDTQKMWASWLLLKFLTTTPEFQAQFSMESGYTPVIESAFNIEAYNSAFLDLADGGNHITALSVKQTLAQRDWYYSSPAFVGSAAARDAVEALIVDVLSGNESIDSAFKKAINTCNGAVK